MTKNHPFHLVTISPWPLFTSLNLLNFLMANIMFFYKISNTMSLWTLIPLILCLYQWWRDVIRESMFQGFHTYFVFNLMKFGMILFIISEIFFFISLFWAYFHGFLSPSIEINSMWPPYNIQIFNPYSIPLLNSIILISSGFTITWSHHSLLENMFNQTKISLMLTIILGIYFSMLQMFEYNESAFCYNDSMYGSTFFMTTGFHGLHVNIGIIFLTICWIRLILKHFSKIHHFNFEAAAWYWHFVDIVWLFVYTLIYWWTY